MAEYLRNLSKTVTMATICFQVWSMSGSVRAGELADPTRPPAVLDAKIEQSAEQPATVPVLQSVLISPTRRLAVINGQTVALGEKYGEARLVKISEGEVVLRNGQDVQVLKLFPSVEKRGNAERLNGAAKEAVAKVK